MTQYWGGGEGSTCTAFHDDTEYRVGGVCTEAL